MSDKPRTKSDDASEIIRFAMKLKNMKGNDTFEALVNAVAMMAILGCDKRIATPRMALESAREALRQISENLDESPLGARPS